METEDMLRVRLTGDLADLDAPPMTPGFVERACDAGRRRLRRRRWARALGGATAVAVVAGSGMVAANLGAGDVARAGPADPAPGETLIVVRETATTTSRPAEDPFDDRAWILLEQLLARQGMPMPMPVLRYTGVVVGTPGTEVGLASDSSPTSTYAGVRNDMRVLHECPVPDETRSTTDPNTGIVDTVVCSDTDVPTAVTTRQVPGSSGPFSVTVAVRVGDRVVSVRLVTSIGDRPGTDVDPGPPVPVSVDQVKAIATDPGWTPLGEAWPH